MNDDIRLALQDLKEDVSEIRKALAGDTLGNKGLVKSFEEHVVLDDNRHQSQLNWNNEIDKKISRYVGIIAGLVLAFQLVNVAHEYLSGKLQ